MLYTGSMDGEQTPMEDAETQLYRRIQELRARARGLDTGEQPSPPAGEPSTAVPSARRARPRCPICGRCWPAPRAMSTSCAPRRRRSRSRLPAQVERAIERAMAAHGDDRQFDGLHDALSALARQIDQVNRDLLAERLGRVEDLELVVDLISTGMAELRRDRRDAGRAGRACRRARRHRARPDGSAAAGHRRTPAACRRPRPLHPTTDDPTPAGSPGSPGRSLLRIWARPRQASTAIPSRVSRVADPMCGTSTASRCASRSGCTRGSCSNTSRPAPPSSPGRARSASAASSTTGPRLVLTRIAVGFHQR